MSLAQLVITAVTIEGRSRSEVARDYNLRTSLSDALRKRTGGK